IAGVHVHVAVASSEALGLFVPAATVQSQPAGSSCTMLAVYNPTPGCKTPALAAGQSAQFIFAVTPRQTPGPLEVGVVLNDSSVTPARGEFFRPNLADANAAN